MVWRLEERRLGAGTKGFLVVKRHGMGTGMDAAERLGTRGMGG